MTRTLIIKPDMQISRIRLSYKSHLRRANQIDIERIACRNPTPSGVGQGKLYDNAVTGVAAPPPKAAEESPA